MQTSGLLNFKKLWGVIEEDLTAGDYQILIDNNYDSEKWEGERHLILTTNSIFGGKNFTIPVFILVSGVFCLLGSVLLIRRRWKILRKK